MRFPLIARLLTAGALMLLLSIPALLVALAKRVLFPRPPRTVPAIIANDLRSIELDASPLTRAPGRYGAWFDNGHAVVGAVLSEDTAQGRVVRELHTRSGQVPAGLAMIRWSGQVLPTPEALGLPYREVSVPGPAGSCPAWLFPAPGAADAMPAEAAGVWAIHIHGFNTTRVTALRSVPAANDLGFTSLVVSFRGDGEGPTAPGAPHSLGTVEHRDVDAALDYAVANGATAIVLIGWSMGGNIALRLAEQSPHRQRIAGLVLISPLAGWRWAIAEGAAAQRLPRILGRIVTAFLGTTTGARLAGAQQAYPLREFDWTRTGAAITHPTLILHSAGDADVPLASSRIVAARNPERVTLIEFDAVPHCMEWNADPERFERAMREWWESSGSME